MFRILSTTAFLQPSVLSLKTISHQGKFFFRRRHQVEPLMKMRDIRPIPPPGDNLELPSKNLPFLSKIPLGDWTAEKYLQRIGGGCSEFADKFETLQELFECDKVYLTKIILSHNL